MLAAEVRDRNGVLDDSEATLRQVARLLIDMGAISAPSETDAEFGFRSHLVSSAGPSQQAELLEVVFRSYGRIMQVIRTLRARHPEDEPRVLREVEHELARVASTLGPASSVRSSQARDVSMDRSLAAAPLPRNLDRASPAAGTTPADPAE